MNQQQIERIARVMSTSHYSYTYPRRHHIRNLVIVLIILAVLIVTLGVALGVSGVIS